MASTPCDTAQPECCHCRIVAMCLQAGAYPFSRPEDERLPAPQRMHVMLQVCCACNYKIYECSRLLVVMSWMPRTRLPVRPVVIQRLAKILSLRTCLLHFMAPILLRSGMQNCL